MRSRSLGLWIVLIYVTGCASSSAVREIKQDTTAMRVQLEQMREDQRRMAQLLVKLQALIEQANKNTNQLRADMRVELQRLARESEVLAARLEDTGQRLARLPKKVQLVVPSASSDSATVATASDSLFARATASLTEAQALYDAAYQDLLKGRYELAEAGFRQFLRIMPEGSLADNAAYWIGECYYAQQRYEDAAREFRATIQRFNYGDKVPAAMLKLAYSEIALKKRRDAENTLQDLIRRYPFSNEAKLARAKLQEIR